MKTALDLFGFGKPCVISVIFDDPPGGKKRAKSGPPSLDAWVRDDKDVGLDNTWPPFVSTLSQASANIDASATTENDAMTVSINGRDNAPAASSEMSSHAEIKPIEFKENRESNENHDDHSKDAETWGSYLKSDSTQSLQNSSFSQISNISQSSDYRNSQSHQQQNAHSTIDLKPLDESQIYANPFEHPNAVLPTNPNHPSNDLSHCFLFGEQETVSGMVNILVKDGKVIHHNGIKIEFVGSIEMLYDRENSQEFTSLIRDLDEPGTISGIRQYTFSFANARKIYDTYRGINVCLRYFLRVILLRPPYNPSIIEVFDIAVQHAEADQKQTIPKVDQESNKPIKMEVGIEDSLHIEFEYNQSRYYLDDVVMGQIKFLLVRVKIKRMELEIRKRETAGFGSNVYNEVDTVAKFEVMDGPPVRGECIPIRMYLSAYPQLTPTYRSVNNRFSVKYFLNLVLIDEDDRRYFKQAEIKLQRRSNVFSGIKSEKKKSVLVFK